MSDPISLIAPALSLAGSIFGGGNKSSQEVTPASTTQNAIPSWLLPLYQASAGFLQKNLGNPFAYPGQTQVGMSPLSQQAYSDIGSLAQLTPLAGGELSADITGAYTDPTQNPVVMNMIAALNNQFGPDSLNTQEALRKLHGNFSMISPVGGSQGYSGAASAEGNLLGTLSSNLSSQIASMLQNVYGQERGIQSNATSEALGIPGLMQNQGGVPTTLAQQNIATQLEQWQRQVANMMGVPSAVFPSVASAFAPSYYTPQYGQSPFSAAAAGVNSFLNSPRPGNTVPTIQPGDFTTLTPPGENFINPAQPEAPMFPDASTATLLPGN